MNPLKELPDKTKIIAIIERFFNQFRVGEELKAYSVVRYVHRHFDGKRSDSTISRYMRDARDDGKINYTYVGSKSSGKIKIIAPGEPHSI